MRILFLTPEVPYPPLSGGTIKSHSILEYLRRRHDVSVLCFRRDTLSAAPTEWAGMFSHVDTVPLKRARSAFNLLMSYAIGLPLGIQRTQSGRMEALARTRLQSGSFDIAFADSWLMARYVPPDFAGLKLLHEHNAEYVIWQRHATRETSPLRRLLVRLESRRVRAYEAAAIRRYDTVFAVSEPDRQALVQIGADSSRLRVLPNLPDPALLEMPPLAFDESDRAILYFGTLSWQPNIEGLEYFLGSVFPLVRARVADARFLLAGRGASPSLRRLAQSTPGVEFIGSVDDAESLYRRARVFIETTRSGGGTKLKILNALARGLPVATTPEAAEGLDVIPGEHLLTSSDPSALADSVSRLMSDGDLWQRLSQTGRALIRERYMAEQAFTPLDEALSGAGKHD